MIVCLFFLNLHCLFRSSKSVFKGFILSLFLFCFQFINYQFLQLILG